ncbi:MAG: Ku protein [Microthrixaceae bacterium]
MPRAVWSGSIAFGLVSIDVRAHSAVSDHEVHFHQVDAQGSRIRYRKVSDTTGEEVDKDDIRLAYELTKGNYVTFERDEINDLRPSMTRRIEVVDFVELDEIDPIFYNRTYWLAPATEAAGRPYRLLAAAMLAEGKVGIGTVVMRNKEYLAAIRPFEGRLALSTMRFADELVDVDELVDAPSGEGAPAERELEMATSIIDSLTVAWDPLRYHDTYTAELRRLIEEKARGGIIAIEAPPEVSNNVADLMAALEASVESAKRKRAEAAVTGPVPAAESA